MCGVIREEEDRLLSGAGGGWMPSEVFHRIWSLSVLQLRHFIQICSQHFGSFYVVAPDGEEQVIVLAGVPKSRHTCGILGAPTVLMCGGPEFCLPLEFGHLILKCRLSLSVPAGTSPGPGLIK